MTSSELVEIRTHSSADLCDDSATDRSLVADVGAGAVISNTAPYPVHLSSFAEMQNVSNPT